QAGLDRWLSRAGSHCRRPAPSTGPSRTIAHRGSRARPVSRQFQPKYRGFFSYRADDMTARRRIRASDQTPDDRGALEREVARLGAIVAEMRRRLIELEEDVTELRAVARQHPFPPPGLVALKRAAEEIGYDRETVRRWAIAGDIASVRRGARWFIDPMSLRAHIASLRNCGSERAASRV